MKKDQKIHELHKFSHILDNKYQLKTLLGDGIQSKVYLSENICKSEEQEGPTFWPELQQNKFALKIFERDVSLRLPGL